jgi:hypothetical protein
MDRAIAALNASSSSLKFSAFFVQVGELQLLFRGQAEGLFTSCVGAFADVTLLDRRSHRP